MPQHSSTPGPVLVWNDGCLADILSSLSSAGKNCRYSDTLDYGVNLENHLSLAGEDMKLSLLRDTPSAEVGYRT